MRSFIITVLFISFISSFFGQIDPKQPIEVKNGIKYYVHTVQGGNTLYGLSRVYSVSIQEIITLNPETEKGLVEGQRILIPVAANNKSTSDNGSVNQNNNTTVSIPETSPTSKTHTVDKSETLYSISKKYGVTMDDLVKVNPGIQNGVQVDQVINLPVNAKNVPVNTSSNISITIKDSIINYTVIDKETLYSLSKRFMVPVEDIKALNNMSTNNVKKGDVIKIPLKKTHVSRVQIREVEKNKKELLDKELLFKQKDEYKIVMLLPFNLEKNKDPYQLVATEFLMGAQVALDSLESLGLKANVLVFDVANDSTKLKSVLNSNDMNGVDLVFGPFLGENLDVVARWCDSKQVRFVNPLIGQTSVLKDKSTSFNAITSDVTLMKGMAKHVYNNYSTSQIILVKVQSKDEELYQSFRQTFVGLSMNGNKQKLIEVDPENINTYLQKKINTVIVYPTREKVQALKFMNNLQKSYGNNDGLTLFVTKEWVNFNDIRGYYKNKYNLHYASSNDFNYANEDVKKVSKIYRVKYNADFTKYAAQGFDATYYFINTLLLNKKVTKGVMNKIQLSSAGVGNGYENTTTFILEHEDYDYIKIAEYNEK